jgi:hypothetical protein
MQDFRDLEMLAEFERISATISSWHANDATIEGLMKSLQAHRMKKTGHLLDRINSKICRIAGDVGESALANALKQLPSDNRNIYGLIGAIEKLKDCERANLSTFKKQKLFDRLRNAGQAQSEVKNNSLSRSHAMLDDVELDLDDVKVDVDNNLVRIAEIAQRVARGYEPANNGWLHHRAPSLDDLDARTRRPGLYDNFASAEEVLDAAKDGLVGSPSGSLFAAEGLEKPINPMLRKAVSLIIKERMRKV